jgi:hypothetical protein
LILEFIHELEQANINVYYGEVIQALIAITSSCGGNLTRIGSDWQVCGLWEISDKRNQQPMKVLSF